jgi:pimeloyl-ACP methyl ester carboxylesterase
VAARFHRSLKAPSETGTQAGLAYAVYSPQRPIGASILVLHGAGSCKENHFDFARAAAAAGFSALAYDQRGHGASPGKLGAGALEDLLAMAALLPPGPLILRGSSMGGYLALVCAGEANAAGVIAVCPAAGELLRAGLRTGRFDFAVDEPALDLFLSRHDDLQAVAALRVPLLLMHAIDDQQVPVEHSRELLAACPSAHRRLLEVEGGDHRSVQHDAELQGESLRWISRRLT